MGICLLTSPFCLSSQSVSLHWLLPSHNIILRSSLSKPCDFSDHGDSHQQEAHDGNLCGQPLHTFYHVSLQGFLRNSHRSTPRQLPQPLIETHLCPQHNAQVATQRTEEHHLPSPCSPVWLNPPIFLCLFWNSKRKGLLRSTALPSCSISSYGNRNQE